jgi:hypothetical protein
MFLGAADGAVAFMTLARSDAWHTLQDIDDTVEGLDCSVELTTELRIKHGALDLIAIPIALSPQDSQRLVVGYPSIRSAFRH